MSTQQEVEDVIVLLLGLTDDIGVPLLSPREGDAFSKALLINYTSHVYGIQQPDTGEANG